MEKQKNTDDKQKHCSEAFLPGNIKKEKIEFDMTFTRKEISIQRGKYIFTDGETNKSEEVNG